MGTTSRSKPGACFSGGGGLSRCAYRGALMADGHVDGDKLICGVHGWDYRLDTGISEYNQNETFLL